MHAEIASLLYYLNTIISSIVGYNSYRGFTNNKKHIANRYKTNKVITKLNTLTIIVIRKRITDGTLMNSKPCADCIETLQNMGIKYILFIRKCR